jgi:hypothetical protein
LEFTLRRMALRLIALFVLFSGAADYLSFDYYDPLASMSAASMRAAATPSSIGQNHSVDRQLSPSTIAQTGLPDDGCICCAPGIPARPIELQVVDVRSCLDVLSSLASSDPKFVPIYPPPRA